MKKNGLQLTFIGLMFPLTLIVQPKLESHLYNRCTDSFSERLPFLTSTISKQCKKIAKPIAECLVKEAEKSGKFIQFITEMKSNRFGDISQIAAKKCLNKRLGIPDFITDKIPLRHIFGNTPSKQSVESNQTDESNIRRFTVKVKAGESWATGTILGRTDISQAIIGVADHMFTSGRENICVWTYERGKGKPAKIMKEGSNDLDMTILAVDIGEEEDFHVPDYANELKIMQKIHAVGFDHTKGYTQEMGHIKLITKMSIDGGTTIGINANVSKGMSGGGVYDSENRLVGLISSHAGPLWESAIYYDNGSIVEKMMADKVSDLSMIIHNKALKERVKKALTEARDSNIDKQANNSDDCQDVDPAIPLDS